MGNASSWHILKDYDKLSLVNRSTWFFANLVNNSFPLHNLDLEMRLSTFAFSNNEIDLFWNQISPKKSPARRLSELFWHSLPWRQIAQRLGSIKALEVGCGSGRYGVLLDKFLGESLNEYVGLDIRPHTHWEERAENSKFRFIQGTSDETASNLKDINLIITQSALEHFRWDLSYFEQVSRYVLSVKYPVIQVHLFPAAACLSTFLGHGIRQYNPRTVSSFTRLFGLETDKNLIALGSRKCNQVHRKYITYPKKIKKIDCRENNTSAYVADLRKAIEYDQVHPNKTNVCFYALLLQSRVNPPLMLENIKNF